MIYKTDKTCMDDKNSRIIDKYSDSLEGGRFIFFIETLHILCIPQWVQRSEEWCILSKGYNKIKQREELKKNKSYSL